MKASNYFLLIGAGLIGFAITFWFVWGGGEDAIFGAFEGDQQDNTAVPAGLSALYGFAMTIIGVVLGSAYRRLLQLKHNEKSTVRLVKLIRDVASSTDLYLGLVGAPIIYGLLVQSLGDLPMAGLTVIAMQNGFMAPALIDQFIKS